MNIKKNKCVYILLGCSTFVLALFRHLYILNPNLGWTGTAPVKLLLIEVMSFTVGVVLAFSIWYSKGTPLKKSDYLLPLIISGILYVLCFVGSVFWFDLPDILPFLEARSLYTPDKLAQLAPFFAILPILMTYFYVEEDKTKRTWITVGVMAFCVVTSAFLRKSLSGIYLMLMVCCIVFGIKEAKKNQANWYLMGAVVVLAVISTVIAYVASGCSSVEHFVIYQYENQVSYIEGEWGSAYVFDGTLADAISKTGFISGTQSEFNLLWTGAYDAPINVLLAYGWLPFILHAISSIIVAVCSIIIAHNIKDDIIKNLGCAIVAKIIVTTIFAYFMLPRIATPLGIRTAHFDFDLVWMLVLLALSIRDFSELKKNERDTIYENNDDIIMEDKPEELAEIYAISRNSPENGEIKEDRIKITSGCSVRTDGFYYEIGKTSEIRVMKFYEDGIVYRRIIEDIHQIETDPEACNAMLDYYCSKKYAHYEYELKVENKVIVNATNGDYVIEKLKTYIIGDAGITLVEDSILARTYHFIQVKE